MLSVALQSAGKKVAITSIGLLLVANLPQALGQTTIVGPSFAVKSTGVQDGVGWNLSENGFVGTYITLNQPGTVKFGLNASGWRSHPSVALPKVDLVVADTKRSFTLTESAGTYAASASLPAGTYFVRTQLSNSVASSLTATINGLTISGAMVENFEWDDNVFAAANTYINHFRKGPAAVQVVDRAGNPVAAGSQVRFKLRNPAFNWGTAVYGGSAADAAWTRSDVPAGSKAAKFQSFVTQHFNMIAPENAGKWSNTEAVRGAPDMRMVDAIADYAQREGKRMRMHTLAWAKGFDPAWANELLTKAATGDAAAKASLRQAISDRIGYYVTSRASWYTEMDVVNESYNRPSYSHLYGNSGLASIYNEVSAAAAGTAMRTYTNEYNVLANGRDSYGNWYRRHVEDIRNAGGNVGGIGVQMYNDGNFARTQAWNTLQNLSVTGLPISLTEFGAPTGNDPATAASTLTDLMTLVFGTPDATTFNLWGVWRSQMWDAMRGAALLDENFNLTTIGQAYLNQRAQWTTDVTLVTDAMGRVSFSGFYGGYDVSIAGQRDLSGLSLSKGLTAYLVTVPEPSATLLLAGSAGLFLARRRRSSAS